MRKIKLILMLIIVSTLFTSTTFCQTYTSPYAVKNANKFVTDYKERVITITDKEISITNFREGTKTQYLVVNKIENKEWLMDGEQKTYYCTTKDKDVINGYQKAIVYKKYDAVVMAMFADEITVFTYQFSIK
jgi:hypothetical protein